MGRGIQSEWIKYRRTSIPWLLFLVPFAVVAVAALYVYPRRFQPDAFAQTMEIVVEVWSGIWLPLGLGLLAGLSAHIEDGAGAWRTLRARNISPIELYGAKLVVLAGQLLLSTLWLVVLLLFTVHMFRLPLVVSWEALVLAMVVNWFVSLPLLLFSMWLAEGIGWAVSIAAGVAGILIASIVGATEIGVGIWPFIPWTWPMRMVFQVDLALTHTLQVDFSPGLFWGVLAGSLATSLVLLLASLLWFRRREVM